MGDQTVRHKWSWKILEIAQKMSGKVVENPYVSVP